MYSDKKPLGRLTLSLSPCQYLIAQIQARNPWIQSKAFPTLQLPSSPFKPQVEENTILSEAFQSRALRLVQVRSS